MAIVMYIWRKVEEACKPEHTIPTVKYRGGSIILWGCFTAGKTGALNKIGFILPKNHYVEMLKQHEDIRRLGKNSPFKWSLVHCQISCKVACGQKSHCFVVAIMKPWYRSDRFLGLPCLFASAHNISDSVTPVLSSGKCPSHSVYRQYYVCKMYANLCHECFLKYFLCHFAGI